MDACRVCTPVSAETTLGEDGMLVWRVCRPPRLRLPPRLTEVFNVRSGFILVMAGSARRSVD